MIKLITGKFEKIILEPYNIKLCFLDPPDNEKRQYENYNDNLPYKEYINLLKCWLQLSCYITNGPVFVSFAEKYIPEIEQIICDCHINLVQRLYWFYTFGQANKKRYTPSLRPVYWLNKDIIYPENIKIPSARQEKYGDKRASKNGKLPNNVWEFSRVCGTFKERRKFHPTQHPEALLERIILGHSRPEETVLDPFIGSGTSAIVCKRLNRNCIGIDVSEFYINKIKEIINE